MQEVTEWNGKPRWMWVWDYTVAHKKREYVLCILTKEEMNDSNTNCPVRTLIGGYKHCAEIEEESTRLTNYELSQLMKCFGVEFYDGGAHSYNEKLYKIEDENEEVPEDHKIRYKQGEWEEPTRETVRKWYNNDRELLKNSPSYSSLCCFILFMGWVEE